MRASPSSSLRSRSFHQLQYNQLSFEEQCVILIIFSKKKIFEKSRPIALKHRIWLALIVYFCPLWICQCWQQHYVLCCKNRFFLKVAIEVNSAFPGFSPTSSLSRSVGTDRREPPGARLGSKLEIAATYNQSGSFDNTTTPASEVKNPGAWFDRQLKMDTH